MRVDGESRPKRHALRGGEVVAVEAPAPAAEADVAARRGSPSPTRTSTCSWSTSRRASSSIRRAGTGRGRSCRRWPAAWPAATTPSARASCTGWTATRPGLLVLARSEPAHAALKAALQAREITREYTALVEGRPPARRGTIDAPLGRDRRVRTRVSTETDEPREAVTHFEVRRGAARRHAARGPARDGPHAPDPRAPARDRPSGRGRSRVRRRGPPRPAPPVPPRRPAGLRPPGHRRGAGRALAAAPSELAAGLRRARGEE